MEHQYLYICYQICTIVALTQIWVNVLHILANYFVVAELLCVSAAWFGLNFKVESRS